MSANIYMYMYVYVYSCLAICSKCILMYMHTHVHHVHVCTYYCSYTVHVYIVITTLHSTGDIYLVPYPDDAPSRLTVNYGDDFTLSFRFVSAFPEEGFELLLNGSMQKVAIPRDPANDQIFSFSSVARSTSGGDYVVRRNVEQREYFMYNIMC